MLIMYHVSIFFISLINSSLTIEFCCKTFLMLILEQAFALSVKTLKYRTSLNIIWITWKNWRAALIIRYTVVILFELHSCKKIFIKKHIGFILKNSFTILIADEATISTLTMSKVKSYLLMWLVYGVLSSGSLSFILFIHGLN